MYLQVTSLVFLLGVYLSANHSHSLKRDMNSSSSNNVDGIYVI